MSIIRQSLRFGDFDLRSKAIAAAIIVGVPALLLAVVLLQDWAEPKWMFLDALTAAELSGDCCHVYYGFMSNLGILLWSGTAAVCLVAAAAFYASGASPEVARFAISASLLTGWIALDDMFLVHELVLPSFGVPQVLVIAAYGALALSYFLLNWRFIARQEWWILLLGMGALGISVVVDTVFHSLLPALVYIEDGAKFIGICCWAAFHLLTVHLQLAKQLARPGRDALSKA